MGEQEGNKKTDEQDSKDADQEEGKPKKPQIYKKPAFIITASIIAVILVVGGVITWLILRQYVTTDDAFIGGHVI